MHIFWDIFAKIYLTYIIPRRSKYIFMSKSCICRIYISFSWEATLNEDDQGLKYSYYTERKNLIESKRSRPMRSLFAANEKIYFAQWYLLFEWPRCLKFSDIESIKILFEPTTRVCLVKRLNNTSRNNTMTQ